MSVNDRYLFKAKRIDNGEWKIGHLAVCPADGRTIGNVCENPPDSDPMWRKCLITHEVDPSTLCQCTGLRDKNGKLIWENDIVDFLGHKGIVTYECGSFGIACQQIDWEEIQSNIMPITGCENVLYACENDNYVSLWEIYWNFNDEDDCLTTVEVIGNKFDNPELEESEEKQLQ